MVVPTPIFFISTIDSTADRVPAPHGISNPFITPFSTVSSASVLTLFRIHVLLGERTCDRRERNGRARGCDFGGRLGRWKVLQWPFRAYRLMVVWRYALFLRLPFSATFAAGVVRWQLNLACLAAGRGAGVILVCAYPPIGCECFVVICFVHLSILRPVPHCFRDLFCILIVSSSPILYL